MSPRSHRVLRYLCNLYSRKTFRLCGRCEFIGPEMRISLVYLFKGVGSGSCKCDSLLLVQTTRTRNCVAQLRESCYKPAKANMLSRNKSELQFSPSLRKKHVKSANPPRNQPKATKTTKTEVPTIHSANHLKVSGRRPTEPTTPVGVRCS